MQFILPVCIVIVTMTILLGTVYFIVTMVQVRRAAKEVETLTRTINALSPLMDIVSLGGSLLSLLTGKIKNYFIKKLRS